MKQFDREGIQTEMLDVINEYPEIFLEPSEEVLQWYYAYKDSGGVPSKKEDLVNLRFGIEFGNGWKEVLRGFCKDIREFVNAQKELGINISYKSCIMKEKFGMFTPQGDLEGDTSKELYEEFYKITNKWEEESLKTCETCGKPGEVRRGGWVKVRCDECNSNRMG